MKNLFFITFFVLIAFQCKADTISTWHVYYNKIKFKEFNQYNNKEKLVLKRSDFKVGDTISIKYYTDTKCHDCIGSFTVECEEKYIVGSDIIENEYLVKFSVEEIIHYLNKNNCKNVVFYLYPNGFTGARVKELLFEVELI
jgi:hypothetical protein